MIHTDYSPGTQWMTRNLTRKNAKDPQAPILPRHFIVAVEAVAVAEGAAKGMQVKMAEILTLEVTVT